MNRRTKTGPPDLVKELRWLRREWKQSAKYAAEKHWPDGNGAYEMCAGDIGDLLRAYVAGKPVNYFSR